MPAPTASAAIILDVRPAFFVVAVVSTVLFTSSVVTVGCGVSNNEYGSNATGTTGDIGVSDTILPSEELLLDGVTRFLQ